MEQKIALENPHLLPQKNRYTMKIAIIGAGSWGLAMAKVLAEMKHDICVWVRNSNQCALLQQNFCDEEKLPNIQFPSSIVYTQNIDECVLKSEIVIVATPSKAIRSICEMLNSLVFKGESPIVVSLTKGIEKDSLLRMSEILLQDISWLKSEKCAVLSGPSHAEEVARFVPTTVVVASTRSETAIKIQTVMNNEFLRVYTSSDILGVELCGALKNVIAIATGILDGLGLGDNTKGALMTRGLAEMSRLGEFMGAHVRTFSGLAGMGDLITTCMSQHSRNRYVGEQIGRGKSLDEVLSGMKMVAEGVPTTFSAYQLSQNAQIEMPITEAVFKILYEGVLPQDALHSLMSRDPIAEGL
jgi:glycerol-3-phosphate dehydrogenase (NAD(P)+)